MVEPDALKINIFKIIDTRISFLHFGVKAKKIKTSFLRYTGYVNSIKTYKARCIASSKSCTTTEISKLLTFEKKHAINYCDKVHVYERSDKNLFVSIKNYVEVFRYV